MQPPHHTPEALAPPGASPHFHPHILCTVVLCTVEQVRHLIRLRQPGAAPQRLKVELARVLIRKVKVFDLQLENCLLALQTGWWWVWWQIYAVKSSLLLPRFCSDISLLKKQTESCRFNPHSPGDSRLCSDAGTSGCFTHVGTRLGQKERSTDGVRTVTQQRTRVSDYTSVCRIMRINDMSKKKESKTGGWEGHMAFPHC